MTVPTPKVSAILVVADAARAVTVARAAVNQFLLQTYQNTEVVIVNSSGQPVLTGNHPRIKELAIQPGDCPTVGAMRNLGIQKSTGDWIFPLDDDDHNHKHRLAFQMAHRQEGSCVLLSHQLRIDLSPPVRKNERGIVVTMLRQACGIPSTILFPRYYAGDGDLIQYDPELMVAEDDELVTRLKREVVLDNTPEWFPGPALHVAIWHGRNVKDRSQFFGPFAAPAYEGTCDPAIPQDVLEYLMDALTQYGLQLTAIPAEPQAAS